MGLKNRLFKVGKRVKRAFQKKIGLKISRLFKRKTLPNKRIQLDKPLKKTRLKDSPGNQISAPNPVQVFTPTPSLQTPIRISPLKAIDEFSMVQLSKHTVRAYKNDLNDFFSYLRVQGLFDHWNDVLSPQIIAQFRDHLIQDKKLAKGSVTRKIAVLKSFFKYALAAEWVTRNPAELIKTFPQTQESKTGFLTDSEVEALLLRLSWNTDRLSYDLARVVIETLLMLGLRRSEACAIRLGDIQFNDAQWLVRINGKGDRFRILPLPEKLLDTWVFWLRRLHTEAPKHLGPLEGPQNWILFFESHRTQPLLVSTKSKTFDQPISDSEIARIVRKWSRKAGLVNRVSPHMLRATAITHALDQGASHRGIQQMAGWTSPLMITRYDKRKKDPKFSAVHSLKYAQKKSTPENSSTNPQVQIARQDGPGIEK
jgi:integrase/recombinase XerC